MVDPSTAEVLCLALAEAAPGRETVTTGDLLAASGVEESAVGGHFAVISAVSELEERGLVETRTQVAAGGDERTVYELTAAGEERADELAADLGERTVTLESADGRETATLAAAAERIDGSLADAAARLQDGVLVLDDVERVDAEAAPFVGRSDELAWLEDRFDAETGLERGADGAGPDGPRVLWVEGGPGVGKTRLATEFASRVDDRGGLVLSGQCDAETRTPYGPVTGAVEALPADARDRVVGALSPAGPDPEPADPEELEQRRRAAFATVAAELERVAAEQPVALVLDDAQWADRPTALLVAHLAETLSDARFAAVVTATPGATDSGDPVRAAVEDAGLSLDRLTLGPFDREATGELVARLVGTRQVPDSFVDRVAGHTGGNPLFVAETVTRLLETGVVRPETDVYPPAGEDLPVPESVEAVVTARLSGLDTETRDLLETAALAGTTVPDAVLAAAAPLGPGAVRDRTALLVESGLWERDGDAVRFASDVVRETVRDGIGTDRRTELHGRLARAYEGDGESRTDTGADAAAAAHHYDRAGETERALEASLAAAEHATDVYAHGVAIEACERAVDLARESGDEATLTSALELLGDTYRVIGEYDEATRCFRYVRERAEDRETRQRTFLKAGVVEQDRSEFDAAERRLERGLELARGADDAVGEGRLRNELGQVEKRRGEFAAAREQFDRALELARAAGDEATLAQSLHYRGQVADKQGDLDAASEDYERALERFRELGDRRRESQVLGNLGILAEKRGDYGDAREYHERSLGVDGELGDVHREAASLNNLGVVEREEGDYEAAREYHRESLERYQSVRDTRGAAQALGNLGAVAQATGDLETAREYFRASLERKREIGDRHGEAKSLGNLGLVAGDEGRFDAARESLEECLALFRDLDDRYGEARSLQFLGDVAARAGAFEDAREYLERGLELEAEFGNRHGRARALDALGRVERAEGDHAAAHECHREALETFRDLGDPDGEAESLANLGLDAFEAGAAGEREASTDPAARFRAARDLFRDIEDPVGEHRCHALLGAAEVANGDLEAGREKLDAALDGLAGSSVPPVVLESLRRHVEAELARGDDERVRDLCERARDRADGTDAELGYERERVEALCRGCGDWPTW